jgi:hypothetical protein
MMRRESRMRLRGQTSFMTRMLFLVLPPTQFTRGASHQLYATNDHGEFL